MLRARDAIDRSYAQPLDIPHLARVASVSEAHFIRTFRAGQLEKDVATGLATSDNGMPKTLESRPAVKR